MLRESRSDGEPHRRIVVLIDVLKSNPFIMVGTLLTQVVPLGITITEPPLKSTWGAGDGSWSEITDGNPPLPDNTCQ